MMGVCTFCKKKIVLSPSAEERAAKDMSGRSAKFYQGLFTSHAECAVKARSDDAVELMRRINQPKV